MPPIIDAVIFDMDGVLADSEPLHIATARLALEADHRLASLTELQALLEAIGARG